MYRGRCGFCRFATTAAPQPPPRKVLWYHFMISAIPMIGFGYVDNTIMLRAGDLIDSTVGDTLKLDTMAAAGLGQSISDVCGVLFGSSIAAFASHLGLKAAKFSDSQKDLRSVRYFGTAGAAVGVFLGCCLGMTNLLFMDLGAKERERKERELHTIFQTVVSSSRDILCAETSTIWLMNEEGNELWTPAGTGLAGQILRRNLASDKGLTVECASTNEIINVKDCYQDPRFDSALDKKHGLRTKSMLCVPIVAQGKVLGVVQFINRMERDGKIVSFEETEAKLGRMLAHHIAIFINQSKN